MISFIDLVLQDYSGLWVVSRSASRLLNKKLETMNLTIQTSDLKLLQNQDDPVDDLRFSERVGNVGIIYVNGILSKRPMISRRIGREGSPTLSEIQEEVNVLSTTAGIDTLVGRFDTPGGSFDGMKEAADAIFDARDRVRTIAFCRDMCCSGGMWLASQMQEIVTNQSAWLGSIGTFTVLRDSSEAAKQAGVEYIIVSSGGLKGKGTPGTEIDNELKEEIQGLVLEAQSIFNESLMRTGRKALSDLPDGESFMEARVFSAANAVEIGIVDRIQPFDQMMAELTQPKPAIIVPGSEANVGADKDKPEVKTPEKTPETPAEPPAEIMNREAAENLAETRKLRAETQRERSISAVERQVGKMELPPAVLSPAVQNLLVELHILGSSMQINTAATGEKKVLMSGYDAFVSSLESIGAMETILDPKPSADAESAGEGLALDTRSEAVKAAHAAAGITPEIAVATSQKHGFNLDGSD